MEHNSIPSKPVSVSWNSSYGEVEGARQLSLKAGKTFFYEKPDGTIIATEAIEAWAIHKAKKFKQVGVSSGEKYTLAMEEAGRIFKTDGLKASQERIRKGFEEELEVARGHYEVPPDCDRFEFKQR